MKKVLPLLIIIPLLIIYGCNAPNQNSILEMSMNKNYDTQDPFIHEKLIYVSEDTDSLKLNVSLQFEGEGCLMEIADNETKEVIWEDSWENKANTTFPISLSNIGKDKEYVVRLTGTKVINAKAVITSDNKLVKEREKPLKPDKA